MKPALIDLVIELHPEAKDALLMVIPNPRHSYYFLITKTGDMDITEEVLDFLRRNYLEIGITHLLKAL